MDDLISRTALIAEYDRVHVGAPGGARKLMEDAPAVDAVPVVYGQWSQRKGDGALYRCSECGEASIRRFKFCPECGADMRERSGE